MARDTSDTPSQTGQGASSLRKSSRSSSSRFAATSVAKKLIPSGCGRPGEAGHKISELRLKRPVVTQPIDALLSFVTCGDADCCPAVILAAIFGDRL
jgi:hypothetical protein